MKNKILLIVAIVVIVLGSVLFALLASKDASFKLEDDYLITYQVNGGYGPYLYTLGKTVELDNNGNVTIYAYVYGEKEVKEYKVSKDGIDDLATEMIRGKFSRLKSNIVENECYDAGSSSLSIKSKKYEKSVYVYCKHNDVYSDTVDDFFDIVGRDKLEEFNDYLMDKYDDSGYIYDN